MTNAVRWEDLSPETFEDICSVLISRLHTEARRIDGAGGDGGRDVEIPTARGPIIFEMKSFTGRLTPVRRRQVEKSLVRASSHKPSAWWLVVPIDPTPPEMRWFEDLDKKYPFNCGIHGRTWLDEKMAAHPDIARYYLQGANDEIVEILRELSQESGALSRGVPDAVDRMKSLARRLNGLDPQYSFGISVDKDGGASVTVWPKYPGAEHDRPLTINTVLEFPKDARGRAAARAFKNTLNYGTPSTVRAEYIKQLDFDLPAGLGESFEGGEFRLGPAEGLPRTEFSMTLRLIDQNGRTKSQIPLLGRTTNSGQRGGDAELRDPTGAFTGNLRVDFPSRKVKIKFNYNPPSGALPSVMLPVLQFIEQYRPPNSVVTLVDGRQASPPVPIKSALSDAVAPFLSLVRALDDIQRATGVYFPFPEHLNEQELEGIAIARRLLAGEAVDGTWTTMTITSTVGALPSLRETVARGPGQLMEESELTVQIAGHDIPLGYTRRMFPTAVVAEWPTVEEGVDPETPVEVKFRPGPDDSLTMVLIKEDRRLSKTA